MYGNQNRRRFHGEQRQTQSAALSDEEVKHILTAEGRNYETFLLKAEKLAKSGLTSSQLRRVYEDVEALKPEEADVKRQLMKIIIAVVYAQKRVGSSSATVFETVKKLCETLIAIENEHELAQGVKNFKDFMEAVVAFSKK